MGEHRWRVRCRGVDCRTEIGLVPTVAGARIPLDVAPTPAGTVRVDTDLLGDPVARVLTGGELDRARTDGLTLFMPHWATCPNADQFRSVA